MSEVDHRHEFHESLEALRDDVVRLGAMTGETIGRGTAVLLDRDLRGAQELIDGDDAIDTLTVDIEERCYQTLALQSPVAGDLRTIVSTTKIAGEFERSADLMVNICKASRRIYDADIPARIRGLIEDMSIEAGALNQRAIDAYGAQDASLAMALDDMDDRLDTLQVEFVEAIFAAHHDGKLDLRVAVQLALIGRYYERIGDHAVNIGERVAFMVTGWMPELTGAARLRMRDAGANDE